VCSNKPKKDGNNFPRSIETRKWFEDKNVVTYSKWKLCNSLQFKWGTAHQQQTGFTADVEIRGRSMIDSSSSFAFFFYLFIFFDFSIFKLFDHSFPPADAPQPPRCPILLNFPRSNDWLRSEPKTRRGGFTCGKKRRKRKEAELERLDSFFFFQIWNSVIQTTRAHCIDNPANMY
jgi:hypothetical protein